MKFLATVSAVLVLLIASLSLAQTPARRRPARAAGPVKPAPPVQTTATPTPMPTPIPSSAPVDTTIPKDLAVLDGQTLTISELDPSTAQDIAQLGEKIAQARREILDVQINTVLLDIEARKRKTSAQAIYDLEVAKRITEPTEAEITKLLDENKSQIAGMDSATARAQAIAYLKGEKEQLLSQEFVGKLKLTNPVVFTTDLNSPDLKPTTVIATVGGQALTANNLDERMKPIIYKIRLSTYQVAFANLERVINNMLLLAEARKRNVQPEDIIRQEVTEKIHVPTDAEVEKFYNDNKAQISSDLASVKYQIATYLREKSGQDLERALSDRLRKSANLRILLTEPPAPVQIINTAGDPSRGGDASAPVTVVEFTDFECPSCAAMHPVLERVLPAYGNRVRFVVKNYPLNKHTHARKAAEAADAANAQGKFFEYTALLFKNQSALDVPSLKKYASQVGIDRVRFDAELDKGVHADDVRHDLEDGEIAGIGATPTIFINGVKLNDLTVEALREAIDKALAKAAPKTP
ncbi:MAG TPA: thioredoxin domain-containing protein [Pyrinomonadaceae bacterium]|nr:thioredoxin domain-containing protein [Pyrinomonadaceae bacterium]